MTVQQFTLAFSMLTQQLSTWDLTYSSFTFHMILHKLLKYEYLMTTCWHMAFVSDSHLPPGEPWGLVVPPLNPQGWKFKTGVAALTVTCLIVENYIGWTVVCGADIVAWRPCVCVKRTRSTAPTRSELWPSSTTRNGRSARIRSWRSSVNLSQRRRKKKTDDACRLLLFVGLLCGCSKGPRYNFSPSILVSVCLLVCLFRTGP